MQELDDNALVRDYVEHESEEAFAELVRRHVDKVYSVALRHTRNPHQAEEITQAVFVILARKSNRLRKHVLLEGWLYQTARLTSLTFIRSEIRRARREQEAHMQTILNEDESEVWRQIAPLLDTAMASLNEADRHALVLRFFYGRSMKEVGAALGGSEGAATLRLRRAVEKLRQFFLKRGIASTTEIIAGAISANSAQVAPAALAKYVTAVALTKGAAASGSTLTLIKGALKIMAWTKAKTAMAAGVAVILAVGTATPIIVHVVHQHEATPSFLFSTTKLTDTDNAKYQSLTGTTPAQVAQEILGTFARKDWTELAKYWHPDQHDMEQYEEQYGGIEVIKLGKPFSGRFRDKGHPAYHGVWVPYEIRFTNGGVRRFQLAIRCDNPDHRWYFDGGM